MVWLPVNEKKAEDTITHFHRIHELERRTDTQTPHDGIGYITWQL